MRIDELDKRLDNEFSSVYKIVLVDGDWGIGKTYLIKNKYKEHKTKYDKVIYASIFGVNSISEINLYMYNELHKVRGWAKKGYDYLLGGKELGVLSISIPFPEIKNTS
ncbi:MAG: P-loop NTPase fold protein, partial [Erysipelotrichaceae bacterium]|nr:P-loop NTPase fold protein [Erysipelotrichaceae bacterium]